MCEALLPDASEPELRIENGFGCRLVFTSVIACMRIMDPSSGRAFGVLQMNCAIPKSVPRRQPEPVRRSPAHHNSIIGRNGTFLNPIYQLLFYLILLCRVYIIDGRYPYLAENLT